MVNLEVWLRIRKVFYLIILIDCFNKCNFSKLK
jgi:hypothetical protein